MSTGQQLKLRGLKLAAAKHADSLQCAQFVAQLLGGLQSTVSINDVRKYMGDSLRNASGSVFCGGEWEPIGFEPVTHEAGHARFVRTWRLRVSAS